MHEVKSALENGDDVVVVDVHQRDRRDAAKLAIKRDTRIRIARSVEYASKEMSLTLIDYEQFCGMPAHDHREFSAVEDRRVTCILKHTGIGDPDG